ncbi:MAG: hypothetical protein FWH55_10590 [Oscillospiraceae bacterium]|nr:hypothetical protein [Oscillospiraceae bacterium]
MPTGWYAFFTYYGDMLNMRTTFEDDIYRWMIIKEIEPCPNGIGMIDVFDINNPEEIRIMIPVMEAK